MGQFLRNTKNMHDFLAELKNEKYAFRIPYTANQEEFIKSLYMKMLCSVILIEKEPTECQVIVAKRILNGLAVDGKLDEYMRKAMDISKNDIQEFISYTRDTQLKYYFVLDALLLTVIGNEKQESYEYIADIVDLLGLNKFDFTYVSFVAKAILLQNAEQYDIAKAQMNRNFHEIDFTPYVRNFYSGASLDTIRILHYTAVNRTLPKKAKLAKIYNREKVIFEGIDITLEDDIHFDGCEEVAFINCVFVGKKHSICFNACKKIEITDCVFKDFTSYTLIETECSVVNIKNCEFENCEYHYHRSHDDWQDLGGVIYTPDKKRNGTNYIKFSSFKNCGGRNDSNYYSSAFISNCNCDVQNCKFYQCWNYYSMKNIDPENENRTMFLSSTKSKNNEIIGSANFK